MKPTFLSRLLEEIEEFKTQAAVDEATGDEFNQGAAFAYTDVVEVLETLIREYK